MHSREAAIQRILHVMCAVSDSESYRLFSLQNCVEISLCGHSCATIYLLTVLGAVPVLHSDDTRCCSVSPSDGDGQCRQRLHRGH